MHTCARYEVSVIKPVARRTPQTMPTPTLDNTQWTIHDYIGSLAFMPNMSKSVRDDPLNQSTCHLKCTKLRVEDNVLLLENKSAFVSNCKTTEPTGNLNLNV